MSDDKIAEALFRGAVCFDPTQDQPGNADGAHGELFEYMLEQRAAWIYPRELAEDVSIRLNGGSRVILHGEKGSGKSTVLHSLAARSATSGSNVFILCDFNRETLQSDFGDAEAAEEDVAGFLIEQLEQAISTPALAKAVEDELDLLILRRNKHFIEARRYLTQQGQPATGIVTSQLARLTQASGPFTELWARARHAYFAQTPPVTQSVYRFRAALKTGVQMTLAIDNIDQLKPEARAAIAKAALGLASLDERRFGIVVACRTANVTELVTRFDSGKVWAQSSMPYPGASTWDVAAIIGLRASLLSDPTLTERLVRRGVLSDRQAFSEALAVASAKVQVATDELWDPNDQLEEKQRAELASALVAWHNGNIRNVAQSLVNLGYESQVDPTHLGVTHRATRRRARNRVYRHIIASPSAVGGIGAHVIHPSLELFVANAEQTAPHRPFYFLAFRLLAYLSHRADPVSVGTVVDAFEDYGVPAQRVTQVLNGLGKRQGYDTGLVRFAGDDGVLRELEEDDFVSYVELLPAGYYVYNHLVTKCEFLYWAALELNDCRERIREATRTKPEDLKSDTISDLNKVIVSTVMLRHYLMFRFEREHPYMDPRTPATSRDRLRLERFRRDFGYEKGNWFIKRVRQSIQGHASEADIVVDPAIEADWEYVRVREGQLDEAVDAVLDGGS